MIAEDCEEYKLIYKGFRKCIQLRQRYMCLSLQRPGDNPKDWPKHEKLPLSPIPEGKRDYKQPHPDPARAKYPHGIPYSEITTPPRHHVSSVDVIVIKYSTPLQFEFSICEDGVFRVYEDAEGRSNFRYGEHFH
jgi:hypothetical protein